MKKTHDNFGGKVVLLTGAASGIGKATALMFARRGAKVVVSDISDEAGQAARDEITKNGAEAIFVKTDVTQTADCEQLVQQALKHFGQLDVAINNAGIIGQFGYTADYPPEDWQNIINVNLTGVFNCLTHELKAMMEKGGAIVNMSSILGLIGGPGAAAYCASKHGVIGLTKSAALEYGRYNIRINAVCPGFIDTGMIEGNDKILGRVKKAAIKRLGKPDEIAEMILWLCSDRASFVTGAAFTVDGGFIAN